MRPSRLTTGYEQVIPYKTSSDFVGKAKQDGKIIEINDKLKTVKVEYKDGTTEIFMYGNIAGESSGMLIEHPIVLHPAVKEGAKFKKNNIITYHEEFFHLDPITKNLSWCHGIPVTMAIMPKDITIEDSSMISAKLADKMNLTTIHSRNIHITKDMVIKSHVSVGDKVKYNDSLIELEYEDTVNIIEDTDELFDELKKTQFKSKYEGEVVDIQVYHVASEFNDSLSSFISKVTKRYRDIYKTAKDTNNAYKYIHITKVAENARIKGVQLTNDDILIVFNIRTDFACGIGDKIVNGNMLKSVISRIEHNPMVTEDGKEIDIVFGLKSIFDRIVLSVFINGISENIIEDAENKLLDIYFK